MKCLYCRKELAIFKRLTGSEFCSDDHRKLYQQEYNQLALSRLMSARAETTPAPGVGDKNEDTQPAGNVAKQGVQVNSSHSAPSENKPATEAKPTVRLVGAAPTPSMEQKPSTQSRTSSANKPATTPSPRTDTAPPMGILVDYKPDPRQPMAQSHAMLPSETVDLDLVRVPPATAAVGRAIDLIPAACIPLETRMVVPRPGVVTIEGTVAPREFTSSVPQLQRSLSIVPAVLRYPGRPIPVDTLIRVARPAALWTSEASGTDRVPGLAHGPMISCDLPLAGLNLAPLVESMPQEASEVTATASDLRDAHSPAAELPTTPSLETPTVSPTENQQLNTEVGTDGLESFAASDTKTAIHESLAPTKALVPRQAKEPVTLLTQPISAGTAKPVPLLVPEASGKEASETATSKKLGAVIPDHQPVPLRPAIAVVEHKAPVPNVASRPNATSDSAKAKNKQRPSPENQARREEPTKTKTPAATGAALDALGEKHAALQVRFTSPAAPSGTNQPKEKASAAAGKASASPLANRTMPISKDLDLNLPTLNLASQRSGNRTTIFMAGGLAAAAVLAIVAFYAFPALGSHSARSTAEAARPSIIGAGPDWIENFSPDPASPRMISVLRSTGSFTDYRIEMEAQIDQKAIGWVFRARDPKNFQVAKIELQPVETNLNPVLVHYPVINGVPEPRKQVPLAIPANTTTVYRLRFEAIGNRFTAYVQDRKVDEWTDSRFPSGGAGLYSDSGERAILQSAFDVTPIEKAN